MKTKGTYSSSTKNYSEELRMSGIELGVKKSLSLLCIQILNVMSYYGQ